MVNSWTNIPTLFSMKFLTCSFPWFSMKNDSSPGSNKGHLSMSKLPKRYAHADNFGFILVFCKRLNVSSAFKSYLSRSYRGKSGSHVANPVKKWF